MMSIASRSSSSCSSSARIVSMACFGQSGLSSKLWISGNIAPPLRLGPRCAPANEQDLDPKPGVRKPPQTVPATFSTEAPGHTSQAPGQWPEDPGCRVGRHQTAVVGFLRPEAARTASGKSIFHQADERQTPTGMFTLNLFGNHNKIGCRRQRNCTISEN
jgi:hypothetical protein